VSVAPILVRGAAVPEPTQLPSALAELSVRNGVAIRPHPDFDTDVARLAQRLREQIG
jgi:hypothetical protein